MGGLIYLIGNFSLKEERIKIGKSKSNPNEFRKDELYSIGVPEPFVLRLSALFGGHDVAKRIMQKIDSFRSNLHRKFFTCVVSPQLLAIWQFTVNL